MGPATILLVYVLGKLENSFPNFSTFHSPLLENKKKNISDIFGGNSSTWVIETSPSLSLFPHLWLAEV